MLPDIPADFKRVLAPGDSLAQIMSLTTPEEQDNTLTMPVGFNFGSFDTGQRPADWLQPVPHCPVCGSGGNTKPSAPCRK